MIEQILQALRQIDRNIDSKHVKIAKGLYSIPRDSKTAVWQFKQRRKANK
jgi:hypothetical protein